MTGNITGDVLIEDPRNHPAGTVLALRDILSGGATILPDPKRRGFYEIQSDALTYYVHISPVTGNVLLLATWPNDAGAPSASRAA